MEKEKLGGFVAMLRKEQGMTQKELAEKLNLTDKAISKWERGLSFPDISILELLANELNVSVMELLQGERIQVEEVITVDKAEEMIQKSLDISDEEISRKHKKNKTIILVGCVLVMFLVSLLLNVRNYISEDKRAKSIITKNLEAYEMTKNENGELVFVSPEAALKQLQLEYQYKSEDKILAEYLKILERSYEGEIK